MRQNEVEAASGGLERRFQHPYGILTFGAPSVN